MSFVKRLAGGLVLLIALTLLGMTWWLGSFLNTAVTPPPDCLVQVQPGTALNRVAKQLEEHGVIADARRFAWLARWEGTSARIQAGDYLFSETATPATVLDRLVSGDVRKLLVTIPEGWTLREIAARVAAVGIGSADDFLALATDPELAARLGVEAATLEGYLFPETYTVQAGTTPKELIRAMVEQCNRQLSPTLLKAAAGQGLDRHQLVTLASIIQKEAGNNAEMPLISAVFHNRLRHGIPLQADPTVIYGIKDFDGNLTRRHLETPTPYNTYRHRGLPPGPIASPGLTALQAAAAPAAVNYLYFVARGDGTHEFTATLKAHNQAVRRYQLRR